MNKKLVELDSLRALMAFAVFISHIQFLSAAEIWSFSLGGMAVTVFIMLSGFAITKSLLGSDASYGQYLARRFWRIYPVYLVGLLLGVCVSWNTPALLQELGWVHPPSVARIAERTLGEHEHFLAHLLAHLALVHGAIPDALLYGAGLTFNSPAWSLSLEWQFYVVAPALLLAVRWGSRLAWPARIVAIVVGCAALAAMRIGFGPAFPQVPSFLPIQLAFFLVGILTAIHLDWLAAARSRLLAYALGLVLLGLVLGGLTNVLAMAIWALTLVASAHTAPRVLQPVRKLLSMPLLALAGEASYSFYIVHEPVILAIAAPIKRAWPHPSHHGFELVLFVASFVPVCVLSWLMFRYIETPINRWAKTRFRGTPLQAAAVA
ncbi:MAG: acyltransferase [Betaproteobacteria bacterium]